jgi:nicotinate phosphoribosyltransferase
MSRGSWVDDESLALLTDLYELNMVQAYWERGMHDEAVFSLFVRRLPERRNYLVGAGLDAALSCLENLHFTPAALAFLGEQSMFRREFLDWLADLRFAGEVWALPEGTVLFADEPILEVVAPLPVAQLAETIVMNQVHLQTVLASKAARVVEAAAGRPVVDFGLRRMHGADAGLKAARAFHIAGVAATSNVLAGERFGIPLAGTMAHSYVQAHEEEYEALRAFAEIYPETVLLVDTYDTLEGVRQVVRLAESLGSRFRVRGIRLDSGDLARLAGESRRILDEAGLGRVEIFASGGLDENSVAELLAGGAPIDAFGVGTSMGVSSDAPDLDIAYKLVEYAGRGRLKLSPGKPILPGAKQVFRSEDGGSRALRDVIAAREEELPGRPLLRRVLSGGKRTREGEEDLDVMRERARAQLAHLPERVRGLERAEPPYPVELSEELTRRERAARRRLGAGAG